MDPEKLENIVNIISKGDITAAEVLFEKPGGRKFLECIVLTVVCGMRADPEEKEDLFLAFRRALNKIEKRIYHQKQGQQILSRMGS